MESFNRSAAVRGTRVLLWSLALSGTIWLLGDLPSNRFCYSLMMLLDLPVATFWLLFPSVFRIDFWFGTVTETDFQLAFYFHVVSGALAYLVLFSLPFLFRLSWRILGFGPVVRAPISLPAVLQEKLLRYRIFLSIGLGAYLLAGATWYLHFKPLPGWENSLVSDLVRLFNLPLAVTGLVLPPELRGLDLWFGTETRVDLIQNQLLQHITLGTLIYSLIPSSLLALRRLNIRRLRQGEHSTT